MLYCSDRKTEIMVDLPHPRRIAAGEIIIDCDHVRPFAGKRVQINRARCGKRLAFARFHLRDFSLVKGDTAKELDVKMPLTERALGRLANYSESLGKY